jgi:hypothetical protein
MHQDRKKGQCCTKLRLRDSPEKCLPDLLRGAPDGSQPTAGTIDRRGRLFSLP